MIERAYREAHPYDYFQVNDVKDVMMENIEKVLERGEKIELLVDKTDALQNQAEQFQRKGKQLRRAMWWQNCRMKIIVLAIVLAVGLIIFLAACFYGGNNCTKSNSTPSSGGSGSITPTSITPVVAWRGRKHWGDRSVSNLLTAIDQRRTVPVARFLFGLGNRRHQRHNYSHITAILQS